MNTINNTYNMASKKLKPFFDIAPSENNRIEGICKLCKRRYKDLYGIYSNFKKHLKRQHPLEYRKAFCSREEAEEEEEDLSNDINTHPNDTMSIDSNNKTDKSSRINRSIAKNLIIQCNLPLSLVENPAFRAFMRECAPKWEPMSIKKLRNVILASFKEKARTTIQETLHNVNDLSLTIDSWSDRRGRSFLGVTCHFIDDEMIPRAYLIDFSRLYAPHTAERIQRQTDYVLDSYNIKEKVFRIITDNASNMIKAYQFGLSDEREIDTSTVSLDETQLDGGNKPEADIDQYDPNDFQFVSIAPDKEYCNTQTGSSVRLSCFAHTLQLAIRDALRKVPEISKVLGKCHLFTQCADKSTKIADLLDNLEKHLERATVTRWNSEFILVKSILSIKREDLESITKLMENPIRFSNTDLLMMQEIIDMLQPFYEISLKCQGENIATVSSIVPSIVHLISHVQDVNPNVHIGFKLGQQLKSALEQRFTGIIRRLKLEDVYPNDPFNDPLYFMAAVLDPEFKFYWLDDLNLPAHIENRLRQSILQLIIEEISKETTQSPTEAVANESNATSSTLVCSETNNNHSKKRKLFDYDKRRYCNMNPSSSEFSQPSLELEAYLNDHSEARFSEYWQHSQMKTLKRLVTRLFSVQASSAPIERVFSHAGLIFSPRRSRMNQELFQNLVFLKVNRGLL